MAENDTQDVDLNNDTGDTGSDTGTDTTNKGDKGADKVQETDDARLTRLTRQVNQQRKKMGLDPLTEKQVEQRQESKAEPSDTLDRGQKALWRSYAQIEGVEEWALVRQEMKNSGISDPEVLSKNPYFMQKLETLRTTKANEAAADTGNRRGNTGGGKDTAEYWLAKLGPNDPVPADLPRDLREKIVQARVSKNKTDKMFYSD